MKIKSKIIDGLEKYCYVQQMDFLKSSEFLSKLHSLHACQLLFLRIDNDASYDIEYIFPPHEGQDNGMSIFINF
jgi:hypothetical protein